MENLPLPLQKCKLSKKAKNSLLPFYCIFGEKKEKKRNKPHWLGISEISDSKGRGYLNA